MPNQFYLLMPYNEKNNALRFPSFSSVAQSCLNLCHPMDCSMSGHPVNRQLLECTRTHVHWVGDAIQPSVLPFSSHIQSFPASESFQMSQFFASDGQSIGVSASASVLPLTIQDWFPLEYSGWISLQPKGLSRAFSNTTVQKHWEDSEGLGREGGGRGDWDGEYM